MIRSLRVIAGLWLCLSITLPVFAHSKPVDLECQWLTDPAGIDATRPELSWQMDSSVRGAKQTGYQILVASSERNIKADRGDLWDSGKIQSDQSIGIPYKGESLVSGQQVFWKVRLWDKDGDATRWSNSAEWSMGLLQPTDWLGTWIGKDESQVPDNRRLPARWLRKEFAADKPIKSATVYMAGLGLSEIYLDGKKLGNAVLSPALSDYTKRIYYVTYDATNALHRGRNAIGVVLGNGRFFAPRGPGTTHTVSYGFPRLMLQMRIEFADGSMEMLSSDPSWKLTTDGPILANNEYDGEEYDARKEMPGWANPGFDDSHWQKAEVVAAPGGKLVAQMMNPIRVTATIKPIAVNEPKPGVFVYDLGQNIVGWCQLKASGPAGTTVSLRHAERLLPDGTLDVANLRSAKVTDRYILKGDGTEIWEPRFTYHGFRYVEVTGFPGKPDLNSIRGRVVGDDLQSAGDFACSNSLLNSIYHNIVWGVRGNYRSMPTDCPQRDERQGWMGDRAAECRGETYLFQNRDLYAKWINDMADSQHPDGDISDVCPAYWPFYNDDVVWPSAFIISSDALLDQFGDKQTFAAHYPQMVRWIDHMASFISNDLTSKDHYGDWCSPPEDPKLIHSKDPARQTAGPILATTYLYHCLQLMTRYATLLNHPDDAARFTALADRLKSGLNAKYLNRSLGQYDNGSQTSSILPLAFNMTPADEHQAVFNNLVNNITHKTDLHIGTGLVGGQWINRVLTENGRADLAYTIATNRTYPSWGYMVDHGATTIWELWNGDTANPDMNSGNHVMLVGDLAIWLYEDLAGIKPDPAQPGFKHIIMHPHLVDGLNFVKATHRSPYGTIYSEWCRSGEKFTWDITVPANSTATVFVPAKSEDSVRESGEKLGDAKGVTVAGQDKDNVEVKLESGSYRFESQL